MDNQVEFWELLDRLFSKHRIIIDRPRGTSHPIYDVFKYPLDYGYLEGTASQDGEGIDVWIGRSQNKRVVGIISSVDYRKEDSEIKILYACTEDEIEMVFKQHNSTKCMKGILNIRPNICE